MPPHLCANWSLLSHFYDYILDAIFTLLNIFLIQNNELENIWIIENDLVIFLAYTSNLGTIL